MSRLTKWIRGRKLTALPVGYIHIGTMKTGTTYIQKTFWQNAALFEQFGLAYPFILPPVGGRYTNAEFLYDRSRDNEARRQLRETRQPKLLISEESIFVDIHRLMHPAFEGLPRKYVLYVRRPAELIASWAAECAQPYNAFTAIVAHERSTGVGGPMPIDEGIDYLSKWYEKVIRNFIEFVEESNNVDICVRPYERESWLEHDLLTDFLNNLGVNARDVRAHPGFHDPGPTNESSSRKLCDISHAAWTILGKPNTFTTYNIGLVREITSRCESGDPRHVVETFDDQTIEALSKRFAFFENFVSERFLYGVPVFKSRYPNVYGQRRGPYRPIDRHEVASLVEKIVRTH